MKYITTLTGLSLLAVVTACGKQPERASEKAAEKAIESSLEKDGSKAKVDLSGGSTKITTTDTSGKTTQMEMGAAKVSEAELGLPFYPGSQPLEGASTKIASPEGSMLSVGLHSNDAADKVATFYRERLKTQGAGKQLMDMSGGDGNTTLMLADEQNKSSYQVHVSKAEKGTDIQIVANRGAPAK